MYLHLPLNRGLSQDFVEGDQIEQGGSGMQGCPDVAAIGRIENDRLGSGEMWRWRCAKKGWRKGARLLDGVGVG